MTLRFALLGDHPDGLDMARALAASGRHRLTVYSGLPLGLAELQRHGLEPQPIGDLEEVLADPAIDAVIVAAGPGTRPAQLRRAIQSERHVLCVHPADARPDLAYEADLLQAESGRVLLPLLPEACHPALRRLAELARAAPPRLIEIERWSSEEVLLAEDIETAPPGLPGWDVLRLLGGEIAELFVQTTAAELSLGTPVMLAGHYVSGVLLHATLLPGQASACYRLTLVGPAARTVLEFPDGWPGAAELSYVDEHGQPQCERWPALDPWAALVDELERGVALLASARRLAPGATATQSLAGAEPQLGWQDEVRALELDDAARRSVLRRRSSTLEHVEATEEASFKGTMTLVGCGMIWLGVALLIMSVWLPWLGWLILPAFAVFLVLQLFRWIVPGAPNADRDPSSTA
jgi:hypothetical protein